jgi:hypothetical protein
MDSGLGPSGRPGMTDRESGVEVDHLPIRVRGSWAVLPRWRANPHG